VTLEHTTTLAHVRQGADFSGFVQAKSARLVDPSGRDLLLRGVGLGNWLLPEGYMWKFGHGAESPREIEALVSRLAGADWAAEFWQRFRDAFITEADIKKIARSGFDHVRLPINAKIIQDPDGEPIEAGYALIDRLIGWCRRHGLWVLLDLHGAPGGQTGTNIDDSPHGRPELFMNERYRRNTLRLWRDIATRYADNTTVLGYDLLNEPLPNQWQYTYAEELRELYVDLTAEIRAVDPDHLLVYEGSHWATNWSIFTEVWDENSLLQFHKYWSSPDLASIDPFLRTRDALGLPIYMGEGGENTLEWLYAAFRMYESQEIGWNFWPWKKIDTRTSPVSIDAPGGWDEVIASIGGQNKLSRAESRRVFDEYLERADVRVARWQPEVVDAVTGAAPKVLPAWGFGFHGPGASYSVADPVPLTGIREDDAVTLRFAQPGGNPANPFEQTDGRGYAPNEMIVARLATGDWLEFELEPGAIEVPLRALGPDGAVLPVDIRPSERGVVLTALAPIDLAQIELAAEEAR
jgi:endoglucanase